MDKIVLLTNEPPPYRVPVFDRIAKSEGDRFHVIFCCRREPNRHWNLPPFNFNHTFLKERIFTRNGRYIHNNPDIVPALRRLKPDVLIMTA
ncbi:MAG: glycosyltransferase family 4 protein [Herminiimonas sp.]|nr:glycosyltransferase family 4 protein [Herminiimonas sp.]